MMNIRRVSRRLVSLRLGKKRGPLAFLPMLALLATLVVGAVSILTDSGGTAAIEDDTTPPTITCPVDSIVEATGPSGAPASDSAIQAFLGGATATDDADPSPNITNDAPDPFPFGITGVTFTATDFSGNAAFCTAGVTVVDTTPPSITCPADIVVEATNPSGVPPFAADISVEPIGPSGVPASDITTFLGGATASDVADPSPTITNDAPTTFPIGSTDVTFTATDFSGNAAFCTASVTVVDTTPPSITCPADIIVGATSPSGVPASDSAIQAFLNGATASDVADPSPTITNDAPDPFPLGITVVQFTATDDSGNAAFCTAGVTVRVLVDIDIKPRGDPNSFNCGSKGVLPVAILGSAGFDATEVDRTTVTLKAPLNTVHALDKSLIKDVNHDGFKDMVVYFSSKEVATEIGCPLAQGTVVPVTIKGSTTDGTAFVGFDDLRISMT